MTERKARWAKKRKVFIVRGLCYKSKDKTMKFKSFRAVNICTRCVDMCTHNGYVYSALTLRLW